MAGHNTSKTTEISTVFERDLPQPLDKWSNISSKANLDTQLPNEIRYDGMIVYVESEKTFYYFKGGITNNDLTLFSLGLEIQGIKTFSTLINTTTNINHQIEHKLNAGNISVTCQNENNELIIVGWKRGDVNGNDTNNFITLSTNTDISNLRVFIIGNDANTTGTSINNLDALIVRMQEFLLTTHTDLDTLQEIGDYIKGNIVRTINGQTPDTNGDVVVASGVSKVNGQSPNASGEVTVDIGIKTVNSQTPDSNGNIDFDGKVKTINGQSPNASGEVSVDIGIKTVNSQTPDSNGNIDFDGKVKTINGQSPNASGEVSVDIGVKTVNGQSVDSNGNVNTDSHIITNLSNVETLADFKYFGQDVFVKLVNIPTDQSSIFVDGAYTRYVIRHNLNVGKYYGVNILSKGYIMGSGHSLEQKEYRQDIVRAIKDVGDNTNTLIEFFPNSIVVKGLTLDINKEHLEILYTKSTETNKSGVGYDSIGSTQIN